MPYLLFLKKQQNLKLLSAANYIGGALLLRVFDETVQRDSGMRICHCVWKPRANSLDPDKTAPLWINTCNSKLT